MAAALAAALAAPVPAAAAPDLGMALMSAVVAADGTLVRGEGAKSAEALDTGLYEVAFARNILDTCTFLAAPGLPGTSGAAPAGMTSVKAIASNPAAINVWTFEPGGTAADRAFHLIVFCGR